MKYKHKKSGAKKGKSHCVTKKEVKVMLKNEVENKVANATLHNVTSTGAGATTWLCDALQGIGDNQRIGDTIKLQYLEFNGIVQNKAEPSNHAPVINHRVIVFSDRQYTGTGPNPTDVLLSDNPFSTYAVKYMYDRPKRYHIYYDKLITLGAPIVNGVATTAVSMNPSSHIIQFQRKLHDVATKFTGVTGTTADIGSNQLFCLYTNDASSTVCDFFADFAVTYKDA